MPSQTPFRLDPEHIKTNEQRIRPHIRLTPIIDVQGADFDLAIDQITLKLELLQHAGSFKARGAFTNLLTRAVPDVGVVAASGGNHGAAVAFAATKLGIPAKIFVPSVSSAAKVAQIRSYGADLEIGGERYADALAASQSWAQQSGALEIHAFDQPETLLGQASAGLELERQAPDLDTVLVAVGGGGFIGGIAAWYAGRTRVIGVEPEQAPTLHYALAAGEPVDAPAGGIAADSLAPRQVGKLMFDIAKDFVDSVVLVPDDSIRKAQDELWRALRIVTEPGGATAMAALLSGAYTPERDERVGVFVCGGNTVAVDFDR
jgi:threonine dehydratase